MVEAMAEAITQTEKNQSLRLKNTKRNTRKNTKRRNIQKMITSMKRRRRFSKKSRKKVNKLRKKNLSLPKIMTIR